MKVALYYPWLYLRSGAERKICEVTQRSRHTFRVLTNHYDAQQTYPEFANGRVQELKRISVERNIRDVLLGSATVVTQRLPLDEFDALLVVSDGVGDLVTLRNHSRPVLCILSTPLRIVFDPVYRREYMQSQSNPLLRNVVRVFGQAFKMVDRVAWNNYYRILCNSPETYKRALTGGLAPAEKLEVLCPGIDYQGMQPNWQYGDYFLVPGRIKWTKNVALAIQAYQKYVKMTHNPKRLIIAGQVDTKSHGYFQKLQAMAQGFDGIEFHTNLSDAEIFRLYRESYAVMMMSLNEDWGMVPLEGMAYGKPVLAVAQGGPLYSILDKKTGYLLEPTARAFAEAMRRLSEDPQLTMQIGKTAREYVERFDWSHYVNRVDELLDEMVDKQRALAHRR